MIRGQHQQKGFHITGMDILVGLLIMGGLAFIAYRIHIRLDYKWHWETVPQYMFRYDESTESWTPNLLMQGFFNTIRLSVWSCILAVIIGMITGIMRTGRSLFGRLVGGTYVECIRNLPPLILIFIFYFFVSDQIIPLLGIESFLYGCSQGTQSLISFVAAPPRMITAFLSALITLAVFEGAYITEIVRAGIQSVDKGQWEASAALGMDRFQQMRHVILPQALRTILPPLGSQFISTIKDSAIVSVISIQELTFQGMEFMASTRLTFEAWITVTALYLVLTLTCSLAVGRLEMRLSS